MSSINIQKIGITKIDVDAIVNAANEGLWEGGGVCGTIFREAGSAQLTKACQAIGRCETGKAVITPGFQLPAKYIIHAVGPVWRSGNQNEPKLLYSAYMQSLLLAKENGCRSIAFPLISAGIFGYPKDKAWKKALQACNDFIMENPRYDIDITFAVLDDKILEMGKEILAEIESKRVNSTIKPGRYRHYKGGEYEVIDVAHHSETEETMVVYRALYGDKELWVRPARMWNETVEVDGKRIARFEYIGD